MSTDATATRTAHPVMPQLVGGLELSAAQLQDRADAEDIRRFAQLLSNAEYWLSFELASFETLLAKCPSPLRELGVALTLKYSESVGGELTAANIERAQKSIVPKLTDDLRAGVEVGLSTLLRAVAVRDRLPDLAEEGFREYAPAQGVSLHALRAMGRAQIVVDGFSDGDKDLKVELGRSIRLTGLDERRRPLVPPEIESRLSAPVLIRDEKEPAVRTAIFMIPGEYTLRVPGRATGERKMLAY